MKDIQRHLERLELEVVRLRPLARRAEWAERELARWVRIAAEAQIALDNLRAERA
jgi:hypothetical protein